MFVAGLKHEMPVKRNKAPAASSRRDPSGWVAEQNKM